jgi:hypothetical protein
MDKSSPTLYISPLIGRRVRGEKGANPGRTEELMIADHPKNVVFSVGEAPNFDHAAGRVPWGEVKLKPKSTNSGLTNNDSESRSGKPGKESTFVYTYSVGRVH